MTAFALVTDVQARAPWTLTETQQARAAALLDDVAAEILVYAPSTPTPSALAKSISCRAVLTALRGTPGVQAKTIGALSTTYTTPSPDDAVYLTAADIASLVRATGGGAFSITPYIPPPPEHHHACP